MNKQQAEKIAKQMVKDRVTAYVSPLRLSKYNKGKKLTALGEQKILAEFYPLVVGNNNYPAIEQIFAEEKCDENSK